MASKSKKRPISGEIPVPSEEIKSYFKWKSWILCNYEHNVDDLTQASEILLEGVKHKENLSFSLNSVWLGKIVNAIWGEKVKLVRRGPRKHRRSCYLNLRPRLIKESSQETFEQLRQNDMELWGGWTKVSDHSNSVSFIRNESWSFKNQRVTIELSITQLPTCKLHFSLTSHGCESDMMSFMDVRSIERMQLSQRIKLILEFIDNSQICRGESLEEGASTTLSHVTGKYVDFKDGSSHDDVEENRVFSSKCSVLVAQEGKCCTNCRIIKYLGVRNKRRKMSRKTIHPHTNHRYLSKSDILRKEKTKKKTDSVPFKEILQDRSRNKIVSHSRLIAFINQHKGSGPLARVYRKSELTALCQAYDLRISYQSSKLVLAEALLHAISEHNCIPITNPVDDRQFRIVENSESNGHIRIRLSRDILS